MKATAAVRLGGVRRTAASATMATAESDQDGPRGEHGGKSNCGVDNNGDGGIGSIADDSGGIGKEAAEEGGGRVCGIPQTRAGYVARAGREQPPVASLAVDQRLCIGSAEAPSRATLAEASLNAQRRRCVLRVDSTESPAAAATTAATAEFGRFWR